MAALTITAANVTPVTDSANYSVLRGIAAATIGPGQAVYRLAAGTIGLADANAATPIFIVRGVALNAATAGQEVAYQIAGDLDFGAILTVGHWYILGATAGEINAVADLASGWYSNMIGYAITTSRMTLSIINTGYAKA